MRYQVLLTDGIYGPMLAVYDNTTHSSYCYLRGTEEAKAHNLCNLLNAQAQALHSGQTPPFSVEPQ